MDDIDFLSTEDIYTYHVLDEGYMGGMLNEDARKVFETLASKMDKIENTYYSLYTKNERTPTEEELYKKCFSNMVLVVSMKLWNSSDQVLIGDYKKVLQESDPDPVFKEALKTVIEKRGLEIPKVEKNK